MGEAIEVVPEYSWLPPGWKPRPGVRVMSDGGGKDSRAAYIHLRAIGALPDVVVAADTHHEERTTYPVWHHQRTICMEDGVPFVMVRRVRGLLDKHEADRRLMLPHRGVKSCSTWAKAGAIRDWLKSQGISNKKPGQAVMLIGYNADEEVRVANGRNKAPKWVPNQYPLYEAGITRADVERLIADHWTGPVVTKSGCVFCPNGGPKKLARCAIEYPGDFGRLERIEATAKPGSGFLFHGFPLSVVRERAEQGREPPKEKDRPWPAAEQLALLTCDGQAGCWT